MSAIQTWSGLRFSPLMRVADDAWWPELDGVRPLDGVIDPWPPKRAAREFLDRFGKLA